MADTPRVGKSFDMSRQPIQEILLDLVWGPDNGGDREDRLSKFLDECAHEYYILREKRPKAALSTADITEIIRKIKSEVPMSRRRLILEPQDNDDSNASVVDCVVRMVFMTATRSEYAVGGGFFTFLWKETETIVDFLDRVYPRASFGMVQDQPINIRNLRALTLMKYTGIQIQPTNKLSDHLHLMYGDDFKTLLVFHHRSFLEYSLRRLKAERADMDLSTFEAVKCGCLHPKLMEETLRTLDLLFPAFGDTKSKEFLETWVNEKKLDRSLLDAPSYSFENEQPPKDLQGLYEQYPYWGRQLARLLRELDDPTPITWWQKYTERGRSPRRMFECAIAALVVTAFSAFVATTLAAVQVWIAYCDWDDAPSRYYCPAKHEKGTGT